MAVRAQRPEGGHSRLKRVTLIGDHHQLPPVVKNMAFQKYSHLDQSLFTRFVRLGTPYLELNAQVRSAGHAVHGHGTVTPGLIETCLVLHQRPSSSVFHEIDASSCQPVICLHYIGVA
jgi:hypothetical protein